MSATDSTQWFWSDWRGDPLVRRLTPAERGLWIDLLSYAAASTPVGYVCDQNGSPISNEEIARFTNATPNEVATLIAGILTKGVASRDRSGRLFNRRMVRKAELSAKRKRIGRSGGEATKLKWQAFRDLAGQNAQQLVGMRETSLTKSKNRITAASIVEGQRLGSEKKPAFEASPELIAALRKNG